MSAASELKRMKKELKRVENVLRRDWEFKKADGGDAIVTPLEPAKFDSMYTNIYGERWWCRITKEMGTPQLLVWGDDVSVVTTRHGSNVGIYPWIMQDGERLWLRANLSRLKEDEDFFASKRAAEGATAP